MIDLANMIVMAKDLCVILWWVFVATILLWFISEIVISIFKTLFCDTQIKLYRIWCKKLKKYIDNDEELVKVLDEIIGKKFSSGKSF